MTRRGPSACMPTGGREGGGRGGFGYVCVDDGPGGQTGVQAESDGADSGVDAAVYSPGSDGRAAGIRGAGFFSWEEGWLGYVDDLSDGETRHQLGRPPVHHPSRDLVRQRRSPPASVPSLVGACHQGKLSVFYLCYLPHAARSSVSHAVSRQEDPELFDAESGTKNTLAHGNTVRPPTRKGTQNPLWRLGKFQSPQTTTTITTNTQTTRVSSHSATPLTPSEYLKRYQPGKAASISGPPSPLCRESAALKGHIVAKLRKTSRVGSESREPLGWRRVWGEGEE